MQDTALMLHTLLELGESMLADGADVRRVEQTLTRMGLAYGAVRMDVFVITSSIVLTMCFPDETSVTQTRRIENSAVKSPFRCRSWPTGCIWRSAAALRGGSCSRAAVWARAR